MRWCAALAVVLVALVVVTVRGLRRPARRPPPTEAEIAAVDQPEIAAPRATSLAPLRRESEGIAELRGRALFPPGATRGDELEVVAEDASRRVTARIIDDRFDLHLPPGRYTLIASAGALVGVVPDILAGPGTARDVDIRLAAGAAIRGTLRMPDEGGGEVSVIAVRSGRDAESGEASVEDGRFSIEGLIAGRQYDLTFRGPGLRALTLTGVSAPTAGLEVELQPRAEIRGAIGLAPGGECPISTVALQAAGKPLLDENEEEVTTDVGDDCHFTLAVPQQATAVTVVAVGDGWHLEEEVAIPAVGDPEAICLNPPCRDEPAQGLARLHLTIDGDPPPQELNVTMAAVAPAPNRNRVHSCAAAGATCELKGLKPAATYVVWARGGDCRAARRNITVAPGDNQIRIPCVRERQIEGVVRIAQGDGAEPVSVRCPDGDDERAVLGTRLFRLTCSADARAVEYQIGPEGAWRSVPVASAEDPAFVDIGPL